VGDKKSDLRFEGLKKAVTIFSEPEYPLMLQELLLLKLFPAFIVVYKLDRCYNVVKLHQTKTMQISDTLFQRSIFVLLLGILFSFHNTESIAQDIEVIYPKQLSSNISDIKIHLLDNGEAFIVYGDNTPILWDYRSGAPLMQMQGHTAVVSQIKEDAKYIYTIGGSKMIVWNKNGIKLKEFEDIYQNGILSFDVCENIAVCGGFEDFNLWDMETNTSVKVETKLNSWAKWVKLIHNGAFLLTIGTNYYGSDFLIQNPDDFRTDSVVTVWDLSSLSPVSSIQAGNWELIQYEYDDEYNRLITLSELGQFRTYDLSNPYEPKRERGSPKLKEMLDNFNDPETLNYDGSDWTNITDFKYDELKHKLYLSSSSSMYVYDIVKDSYLVHGFGIDKYLKSHKSSAGYSFLSFILDDSLAVYSEDPWSYKFSISSKKILAADSDKTLCLNEDNKILVYDNESGKYLKKISLYRTLFGADYQQDGRLALVLDDGIEIVDIHKLTKTYYDESIGYIDDMYVKQFNFAEAKKLIFSKHYTGSGHYIADGFRILDLNEMNIKFMKPSARIKDA